MAQTATTQEIIANLAERYPEDANDLTAALEEFQRQKLGNRDRLARLTDAQWQRLGLPLGIEALIREELTVAPQGAPAAVPTTDAPAQFSTTSGAEPLQCNPSQQQMRHAGGPPPARGGEPSPAPRVEAGMNEEDDSLPLEPYDVSEGLRRRGHGGSRPTSSNGPGHPRESKSKGLLGPLDLQPPADLEILWRQLLEDTLPPDKRPSLQAMWDAAGSDHDRYLIYLEYSSYLRKPEISEEEKAERRKQLEPLMRELGLKDCFDEESQSAVLWWLLVGFVVLVAGLVYYAYTRPDPLHDLQGL